MPWYWTDEIAPILVADGSIDTTQAETLTAIPVAHRSEHDSIEEAAKELMDNDEIPLAA